MIIYSAEIYDEGYQTVRLVAYPGRYDDEVLKPSQDRELHLSPEGLLELSEAAGMMSSLMAVIDDETTEKERGKK